MGAFQMKNTALKRIARDMTILAAATGIGALTSSLAGERTPPIPTHYAGLISDYTTSTVKNGPYQIHGKWRLDVDPRRETNHFTAELNMETSDIGITAASAVDPTLSRGAHTHHLLMTDGKFGTDLSICPAFVPALPAAVGGFTITGQVYITVNGGSTPFANPSSMTLCVLGGTLVQFSNLTLQLDPKAPAAGHFGSFPIHGVIVRCEGPWDFNSKDCTEIPD
jgi:hypothetical protein